MNVVKKSFRHTSNNEFVAFVRISSEEQMIKENETVASICLVWIFFGTPFYCIFIYEHLTQWGHFNVPDIDSTNIFSFYSKLVFPYTFDRDQQQKKRHTQTHTPNIITQSRTKPFIWKYDERNSEHKYCVVLILDLDWIRRVYLKEMQGKSNYNTTPLTVAPKTLTRLESNDQDYF